MPQRAIYEGAVFDFLAIYYNLVCNGKIIAYHIGRLEYF